jgi:omega-hydroxy-beta-dihydromenaquinone-9 sulfotransferase
MDWRESFLIFCGPGLLGGITFGQWCALWRRPELQFDLSRAPRILSITSQSVKNSVLNRVERARFQKLIDKVEIVPPLFILGHWRNGTTLLHHLLTRDERFGFPNGYQVSFPHTFLTAEARDMKWLPFFVPRHRPMDNMRMDLADPQEDEFALCVASLKSPCLGWIFPRQREVFEKYLTFQEVDKAELDEWRRAFLHFVRKVQWRSGARTLILKSPQHTARVRLLLDLFPEARFVHIHRNPYAVFQSTCRSLRILHRWQSVQRTAPHDVEDWVLGQYREMYNAFFQDKGLIPSGRFHEIAFEDLEREPAIEMRKLYEALQLPDFDTVEPGLRKYLDSLTGYQKNQFPELGAELRSKVHKEWKRNFDAWGYPA